MPRMIQITKAFLIFDHLQIDFLKSNSSFVFGEEGLLMNKK